MVDNLLHYGYGDDASRDRTEKLQETQFFRVVAWGWGFHCRMSRLDNGGEGRLLLQES